MFEFISENSSLIIIATVLVVVVAVAVGIIQGIMYKKEHLDGIDAEIDKMFIEPEALTETVRATVVDMVCYTEMTGIKKPKSKRVFKVSFETENGEIRKINVPEEMYDGFDKGQTGLITLVDGELYGFELE